MSVYYTYTCIYVQILFIFLSGEEGKHLSRMFWENPLLSDLQMYSLNIQKELRFTEESSSMIKKPQEIPNM
jgi:hypothetical protein